MKSFRLIKSFCIDNDELVDYSKPQCFVLGYELATIDYKLKTNEHIYNLPFHAANRHRVENAAKDSGRLAHIVEASDPLWLLLTAER
jgi:hypothetical protein